jgi:translation initiation factor 1 (eIF-1/SUI1)
MAGRMMATRKHRTVVQNPATLADMLEEVCATNGSIIEASEQRIQLKGTEAKKHGN